MLRVCACGECACEEASSSRPWSGTCGVAREMRTANSRRRPPAKYCSVCLTTDAQPGRLRPPAASSAQRDMSVGEWAMANRVLDTTRQRQLEQAGAALCLGLAIGCRRRPWVFAECAAFRPRHIAALTRQNYYSELLGWVPGYKEGQQHRHNHGDRSCVAAASCSATAVGLPVPPRGAEQRK